MRRWTVREVARVQTFNDASTVAGSKKDKYRQVGNAVPALLTWHLAVHYREPVFELGGWR
jgi:DNA (cytosine-5)-methyltransferase 1